MGRQWRRDDQNGGKQMQLLFLAAVGILMVIGVYSLIQDPSLIWCCFQFYWSSDQCSSKKM